MDDGSIQNKGLHLNVYGFTFDEVLILKNTLENLFISFPSNINNSNDLLKCSIHNHKKGYRIYI